MSRRDTPGAYRGSREVRVCAYCSREERRGRWVSPRPARRDRSRTHGICPSCLDGRVERELRAYEAAPASS